MGQWWAFMFDVVCGMNGAAFVYPDSISRQAPVVIHNKNSSVKIPNKENLTIFTPDLCEWADILNVLISMEV